MSMYINIITPHGESDVSHHTGFLSDLGSFNVFLKELSDGI